MGLQASSVVLLDSSAIIAVIFREPGFEAVLEKILTSDQLAIGAPTLAETEIVLTSKLKTRGRTILARFIQETHLEIIPFGEEHYCMCVDAYQKYGKGNHPARLNFGDCLTYAIAKLSNLPLLFVGDDFSKTDLLF